MSGLTAPITSPIAGAVTRAITGMGVGSLTPTILTGPTWTDNGDGTATIDPFEVSTELTGGGIDYGAASGTYTASSFIAGPVTDLAPLPVPESPGTEFGAWYWRPWGATEAGFSGYIGPEEFDSIAPVLSAETDGDPTTTGTGGATVGTNCPTGTLYWCLVTDSGSATNPQIIAGTGGDIVEGTASSQAVSGAGTQTFDVTGAAASTAYQIKTLHVVQGAESNQGSVNLTTAASFPTANLIAHYQKGVGQTAGQWDDQSGNANHMTMEFSPTISGGAYSFDGINQRGSASFTLPQPCTVYLRAKVDTHIFNSVIVGGMAFADGGMIYCAFSSPEMGAYNRTGGILFSGEPAVGTMASWCVVWDGASNSVARVNATAVTGNGGTHPLGGISLASSSTPAGFIACTVEEVMVYNVAHDTTAQDEVISYLNGL